MLVTSGLQSKFGGSSMKAGFITIRWGTKTLLKESRESEIRIKRIAKVEQILKKRRALTKMKCW